MSNSVNFVTVSNRPLGLSIFLISAALVISIASCSRGITQSKATRNDAGSSQVANIETTPSPSPTPASPIRRVDFRNMTYPAYPIYPKGEKPFELRDGEYEGRTPEGALVLHTVWLTNVMYGDVTRDGQEDAIVLLTERLAGIAIPCYVFVYTLEADRLKLLWAFETGDRGDGGLKQITSYDGDLVIELYGKGTYIDGNLGNQDRETPAPRANFYTRSRYTWTGKRFDLMKAEVLPNAGGDTHQEGLIP
jgi:hypothetical protein